MGAGEGWTMGAGVGAVEAAKQRSDKLTDITEKKISRLCSVGYAFLYTRGKYPGITRTRQVL